MAGVYQWDDVHPLDGLRADYQRMGILDFAPVDSPMLSLAVDQTDRLDPHPTADEKAFWGSPLGIDGWQPDFMRHHFPVWHKNLEDSLLGASLLEEKPDIELHKYTQIRGPIETTEMPMWHYSASNLTPNESSRLKHRIQSLCPLKDLKTIAENCQASSEGMADPSHCWLEKTLFITCNEFKKSYLNNRQRLLYIYGAIKDDVRDQDGDSEEESRSDPLLNPDALYVLRWEFYRLQYKEGKRNIFMRQMKNYKAPSWQTLWHRLTTPSTWFSLPAPAPHAPRHVKNYMFRGHHWLSPTTYGLPAMPLEDWEDSIYGALGRADPAKVKAYTEIAAQKTFHKR